MEGKWKRRNVTTLLWREIMTSLILHEYDRCVRLCVCYSVYVMVCVSVIVCMTVCVL